MSKSKKHPHEIGPPADVKELLARLEAWLGTHRKRYLDGLAPGATTKDIKLLAVALGSEPPPELVDLLSWRNGQAEDFIGSFEQSWNLLGVKEIIAVRQEMHADKSSGWRPEWVPFLGDDHDNYVFLDTSKPGIPVRAYWQGNLEQPQLAESFPAWLQEFVEAVERGGYVEDPERGEFLRRS